MFEDTKGDVQKLSRKQKHKCSNEMKNDPLRIFFFLIKINRDPQNTTQITNDCATWSAQKSGSDTPGVSGTCFSSGICCANFVKTILWQVMNKESTGFWLRQRNVSLVIYLSHVTDTFHYTKLYRVHLRIESTNLNDDMNCIHR